MKKVWRCSACAQMSTRLGNMKRHLKRKHGGKGQSIMQYIFGNSIITPDSNTSPIQIFHDDYATRQNRGLFRHQKAESVRGGHDSLDDWVDRYIQPILKIREFRDKMNSFAQTPIIYRSHPVQNLKTLSTTFSIYNQDTIDKRYDNILGFKADVCAKCLECGILPVGQKSINILDIHKCDPERMKWVSKLQPLEYVIDLADKIRNLSNVLFQECKEWATWANKTNRHLYLESTKLEPSDSNELLDAIVPLKVPRSSFLSKLITNSRIMPDDKELKEFLNLAANQTKTVLAFTDSAEHNNVLAVKCIIC